MALCSFLVVSASLISPVFGVDFATCKDSSCPAWKEFLDDSAKEVTIQKHSKQTGTTQYYRIGMKSSSTSFTKLHRYRAFETLKNKLGDAATGVAPFPPKLYLNSVLETFWPSKLEERREQLEVWLQSVLAHSDSKGAWAQDLFLFLDPVDSAAIAKAGVSMPPDANKICHDDKLFFGIDVDTTTDRVWRRYNDFEAFHAELEKLGGMTGRYGAMAAVPFPPKIFFKGEEEIEKRRRGLEVWLAQVKLNSKSDSGGIWEQEVKKFLDPAGNKNTLSWGCQIGDAASEYMAKMHTKLGDAANEAYGKIGEAASQAYGTIKDKINNYMEEQKMEEL